MSQNKILIVEDTLELRSVLKLLLESEGFDITEAVDGQDALRILESNQFDLVVSDITMPKLNGVELFESMQNRDNSTPFVIMTGGGDISTHQEACDHGMQGFIEKPFVIEDLVSTVKSAIASKGEVPKSTEDEFCRIPIDYFLDAEESDYSVYIEVSEKQYLKIAHRGDHLDQDRVESYRKKGVRYLYFLRNDFKKFLTSEIDALSGEASTRKVTRQERLNLVNHVGSAVLDHFFHDDVDSESLLLAKSYVETAVDTASASETLFLSLLALQQHSTSLFLHSIGVSLYSVLIAKEREWNNPSTLYKVALGGMLHDLGKKEIDPKILEKSESELKKNELSMVQSHVSRGVEILSSVKGVSEDVLQMIHHHHERSDGSGYPQRLRSEQIYPLSKVVALANSFIKIVFKSDGSVVSPKNAFRELVERKSHFDEDLLRALKEVIISQSE